MYLYIAGLVVKITQHGYNLTLPDKYKIDPKKAKKGGPIFPPEIGTSIHKLFVSLFSKLNTLKPND